MNTMHLQLRQAAAIGWACAALMSGGAHAAITTYTTPAAMTAATANVAVDSFNNLALDFVSSPATRTIGGYTYRASAPGGLYAVGSAADVWLSTDLAGDVLTFGNFTGGVNALGGLFFGSDASGVFLASQALTLTATDAAGASATLTLGNATTTSFAGFVSTVQLTQVQVSIANANAWVAANNVMFGSPVPEPATWALWLAGLAGAASCAARRRRGGR